MGRGKAGVETCDGSAWSACAGVVTPAAAEDCGTPDDGGPEPELPWEGAEEAEEVMTMELGGAWPAALLRSCQTASTRASYMIEQERWADVRGRGELR